MLSGNLATRPFYNERVVTAILLAIALVAAAVTWFNARELVALTRERAALGSHIEQDRAEAVRINERTAALQQSVDRTTLSGLAAAAHEANDLIARRTFSWTAFFGLIERTLPIDVRLVAVSPRTERGVFRIQMNVVARDLDHIDEFTAALLGTGAFRDVVPVEQRSMEDGAFGAVLEALYFPLAQTPSATAMASRTVETDAAATTPDAAGAGPSAEGSRP